MHMILRASLALSLLGLVACDELAVANDPEALADLRGQKSCVAAVAKETGASGVAVNTTLPVVEASTVSLSKFHEYQNDSTVTAWSQAVGHNFV